MGLSAEVSFRLSARQTGTNEFGGPDFTPVVDKLYQLVNGTLSDQCDILWVDERTFAASTADPIDLYGSLQSAFGATLNMAEIVAVVIIGESIAGVRTTVTLSVGAGTNPWFGMFGATGDIIKVPPGGMLALVAPDAAGLGTVTAATADILNIVPGAATGTFQIAILARSA